MQESTDSGNHAIRKIAPDGTVTTLPGTMGATGSSYTTPILPKDVYRYWVRVTGSGFANSTTAVITAN